MRYIVRNRTNMNKIYVAVVLMLAGLHANAQTPDRLNQEASPKGGVEALVLEYYRIDFTKAQRERLRNVQLEFIYQVDAQGTPSLAEVNGVNDRDILDSLRGRTPRLPAFNPRIVDGTPQPSLYAVQLVFPTYRLTQSRLGQLQAHSYQRARLEDFEYIHKSAQRFDVLLGGVANQFVGNPARHLVLGGGMKVDVAYAANNRLVYGLNMSIYGNRLKREYPLAINREQLPAPVTLLVGAIFGKWFNRFSAQLELSLAYQNVTENQGAGDTEWVQLNGWSPGLVVNYPLQLGRDRPHYSYGSPTILAHYVNLHLGVRPVFLSLREATGGMVEVGLSYRMAYHLVDRYKLKESFGDQ